MFRRLFAWLSLWTVGIILTGCGPTPREVTPTSTRARTTPRLSVARPTPTPRRRPPLALPTWARMVRSKLTGTRQIRPRPGAKLRIGAETLHLQWADKLVQTGPIRWKGTKSEVPVRLEFDTGWVEVTIPTVQLLLPVPAGTQASDQPGGKPRVLALEKMWALVKKRRGTRVQVVLSTGDGGGVAQVWLEGSRLEINAQKRAVPPAWVKPAGRRRTIGKKGRCKLDVWIKPNPSPVIDDSFAELNLCLTSKAPQIHLGQRKGGWVRIHYRADTTAPLIVTGWVDRTHVRKLRRCSCVTHRRGGGSGVGHYSLPNDKPQYTTSRDLPLYVSPDQRSRPIGVLRGGSMRFDSLPRPRSGSSFVPVKLGMSIFHCVTLYVPHRPTFFKLAPRPRK